MVTNVTDNPAQPSATQYAYLPDQLIAGDLKLVTATVTIVNSANLVRGTVLGQITSGGKYKACTSSNGDGSETPVAILADDAAANGQDVLAGVYLMGEFNASAMTVDSSISSTYVKSLRSVGIYVKTAVTATDPTDP